MYVNTELEASPRVMRLAAFALDMLFMTCTLIIGWLIWSAILWKEGTTPGHKLMKQKIVSSSTGEVFTWQQMAVREFLVKFLLIGTVSSFLFWLPFFGDSLMIFKDDNRTFHDMITGSIVVDD